MKDGKNIFNVNTQISHVEKRRELRLKVDDNKVKENRGEPSLSLSGAVLMWCNFHDLICALVHL